MAVLLISLSAGKNYRRQKLSAAKIIGGKKLSAAKIIGGNKLSAAKNYRRQISAAKNLQKILF